jgi:hypothetical protein
VPGAGRGGGGDPDIPRLDRGGAVLAVIGLVALVYSIIEAPGQGWTSARTLAGLAAGLVVLAGFVAWECRRRAPMLDPRVFGHRGLGLAMPPATSGITSALPAFADGMHLALLAASARPAPADPGPGGST